MMSKRIVVALGGNAIQTGNGATADEQQQACIRTARELVKLIKDGHKLIITHGNGPQVGNLLLQQKAAESETTPALPLDTCGAMSEGMIGYWLQNAMDKALLENGIEKDVVTVVTRTLVEENDPAFVQPTKPIGPFYTEEEAKRLEKEQGFVFKEDAGRGWRRVVPSPKPTAVLEYRIINQLVDDGDIVIAGGGGGIPVIKGTDGIEGVEAVIDKDFASQKLAELVDADILLILTAVPNVAINFNQPNQQFFNEVTVEELKKHIADGQFAPGSMLPKVEAAIEFAKSRCGRKTIITSLTQAYGAITNGAGTHIIAKEELVMH
ncbi:MULTISPECIES: carbamate kinase [Robertmurraya]|nr:carbamate kinase [Robertmurraya siralis]PAE20610.1 carbamate kinase [Bacillus sp. 7504-2]